MTESIRIAYKPSAPVPISKLNALQGDLKELSDENYQKLKKEIIETGFAFSPHVWIDKNGKHWLVDGHQRIAALRRMEEEGFKIPKIPIISVQAKGIKEAKRRVLQGISQYGKITETGLRHFIEEGKFDVDDLKMSFDFPEIDFPEFVNEHFRSQADLDKESIEDEIPELSKEPKTKLGDLYQLGNHRLLCGDSTNIQHVERLMDGDKCDFTITSPPYNVGLDYNSYDDNKTEKEYEDFLLKVLNNIRKICTNDYWLLWNVGVYPLSLHMHMHLLHEHFKIKRSIAWIKSGITGPPMMYHMQKNPVVKNYTPNFGWEIIACCHLDDSKKGTKIIPSNILEECRTDVWQVSQAADSRDQGKHPGSFPVKIPERSILLYCENNVYEPFGGSGSTLIACEKTNRKCFMMEIDPVYCDVIITRWEKYTGRKVSKL